MYIAHVAVLGKTSERGLELLNSALNSAGLMVVAVRAYDECDGVHNLKPYSMPAH